MIKIYTTLLFAGCFCGALNAQQTREVRVESSGVIVHEGAGVEGFQKPEAVSAVPVDQKKEISSLNLSQCIDAADQIGTKLRNVADNAENKEQRARYSEVLIQLEDRIKSLTNSSK